MNVLSLLPAVPSTRLLRPLVLLSLVFSPTLLLVSPLASAQEGDSPRAGQAAPATGVQHPAPDPAEVAKQKEEKFEDEANGFLLRKRMDWFYGQRAYPLKRVPTGARQRAFQQLRVKLAMEAAARAGAVSARKFTAQTAPPPTQPAWTLIGPQPVSGDYGGFNAGRVTALAINPTQTSTIYMGGAEGGVWKSTDSGATWTALTDSQASLAVGSIALDPENPQNVYVGTGEQNFSGDSYYGAGVLKSTDGGATWTQYASSFAGGVCGGAWIGSMAVHPTNGQIVLAGVAQCWGGDGVYRSADGGRTWTDVLPETGGGPATTVIFDHTNGNLAYASLNGIGVYKSMDGGQTWTVDNGTGLNVLPTANAGRIAMAMAPSNTSTLYVGIANSSTSELLGFYKTVDGGANWTQLTSITDYCGGQCWYDNVIAVSPVDANIVVAGGQYNYSSGGSAALISTDGGNTWTDHSNGLHPDVHALVFTPDGTTLYDGNDGGVWSTANPTAPTVTWTNLNNTLAITEFYPGISIDPGNVNHAYAGTQDNYTEKYTGSLNWQAVDCGDGGETAIDFATPTTVYTNCIGATLDKSTNDGANFNAATTGINTGDRTAWVPPFTMDPNNSQTLYFGTYLVYQSTNAAGQWTAISPDLTSGGTLSAIAVAPTDSNTVYTGSSDSQIYVSRNALSGSTATWTKVSNTTQLPGRSITWIAVDPTTPLTAYATFSGFTGYGDSLGHVFRTTNAGTTWTDISGDLPNAPVSALVIDPDNPGTLFIGTDVGMFYTTSSGASWSTLGTGLPNVVVTGLALHNGTRTLRAATHGRSIWDLNISTLLTVPSISSIQPTSAVASTGAFTLTVNGVQFDSSSVVRWNGTALTTTFVSAAELTAAVPASDIATAGTASITVLSTDSSNPSNAAAFTIDNPVAAISSLSPSPVIAGSAAFTLTVNGSNFINGAVVQWNGAALVTTFVSSSQVTAAVPATNIALAGTANVTVVNPAPGGGASAAATLTIDNPVPALKSISPVSATAGQGPFTLVASGTNFVNTSQILWRGAAIATTYVSATQVEATIPASDIALAGYASVGVSSPTPGGGSSSSFSFPIDNPLPWMGGLSTKTAIAGGPAFTLTVTGGNFVTKSVVDWGGVALATTYVNSATLTAVVPASDIATAGPTLVTVTDPTPGGGVSGPITFTTDNPVPTLTSLSPSGATANGPAFTLTVTGTNFVSTSVVNWKGAALTTTYVNATTLTAAVPAADILTAATDAVTVSNPAPGGGASAAVNFTASDPAPTLSSISPKTAGEGGAAFTLTVTGTNFVTNSVVTWAGASLPTTYASPTQITAAVPASDIVAAGTPAVLVSNPAPGGGSSSAATFTVTNPGPTISSLSPASATAGGGSFTMTVNGTNFVSTSQIVWNGTALATTFVSSTKIYASVPVADIATAGTAAVTVTTPPPSGGTSGPATFTIDNPLPSISSLSPSSATANGPAFTLTVNGSNFVKTSVVNWNGSPLATTYVSAAKLTAPITAADILTAGTEPVTVSNPTPGGGTSSSVTFTANDPVPAISGVSPTSAIAGGAAFTLTVNGGYFVTNSVVKWNNAALPTTYVSASKLTAAVPASDIATAGTAALTVFNPSPAGGTSSTWTYTIDNPVPTLASLSPSTALTGQGGINMTVTGTNFVPTTKVLWKGAVLSTVYTNSTTLVAWVPATNLAAPGTTSVTVNSPTPGGGTTSALQFSVLNALPVMGGLNPNSVTAGGAAYSELVYGESFLPSSVIEWNGVKVTTTYVSNTQLTTTVPASSIALAGTANITVFTPTPGGGTSASSTFTINNPSPALTAISPTSAATDGQAFTLTATGTSFVTTSAVTWNGVSLPTTYVSATTITAAVPAADLTTAGSATIRVVNPAPGGATSHSIGFPINNPAPGAPTLSPSSATHGGAAFVLTVTGANFVPNSVVDWKGAALTTTFVSATKLTATVPAADIGAAGTAGVTVYTPGPGGGTSTSATFTIN